MTPPPRPAPPADRRRAAARRRLRVRRGRGARCSSTRPRSADDLERLVADRVAGHAAGAAARVGRVLRAAGRGGAGRLRARGGAPRCSVERAAALLRPGVRGARPVLRHRARSGPRSRPGSPGSRCAPPTSTRPRWPARAATCRRSGSSRATCTTRCRPRCAAGSTCWSCNAPYVPTDAIALMPPEARDHEHRVALDGGADGLDVQARVVGGRPGMAGARRRAAGRDQRPPGPGHRGADDRRRAGRLGLARRGGRRDGGDRPTAELTGCGAARKATPGPRRPTPTDRRDRCVMLARMNDLTAGPEAARPVPDAQSAEVRVPDRPASVPPAARS